MINITKLIFDRGRKVVLDPGARLGDSIVVARQLDAVLMAAGFKCSADLLKAFGTLDYQYAVDRAVEVIGWARELAGDNVQHNVYFIDFPRNVPDTEEFWAECLRSAVSAGVQVRGGTAVLPSGPQLFLDLLSLPSYGRYQHTYAEMLEHHDELLPVLSDRITVIHLGGTLVAEAEALFSELAGSTVPLSGHDLEALRMLAGWSPLELGDVPVRENKAVINAHRLLTGLAVSADTVTDFLRLACELSGGDVSLVKATKFSSKAMGRPARRDFMRELDLVAQNAAKLGDVAVHAEAWKRLGERVHPHEFTQYPAAQRVFQVARGEEKVPSLASQVETAFALGRVDRASQILAVAPGMFARNLDRLLRQPAGLHQRLAVLNTFSQVTGDVSGRVLLSVREHFQNRDLKGTTDRVFANRSGRAMVMPETRAPIAQGHITDLLTLVDEEVASRLPAPGHLVVDPAILGAALPLSGKPLPEGLGVFPRGSVTPVPPGEVLRFFTYWHEKEHRTDFDLSALFTDENFANDRHVSYTNLSTFGGTHSGDIVESHNGASEFIDVELAKLSGMVIPQVYVFSGEQFDEVQENFFGFMTRGADQRGRPFEPRTVRMRSALFGHGRVALPMAFRRGEDGKWYAKWLHLYLSGQQSLFGGVQVEGNKASVKTLVRSIMSRDYLRVSYMAGLLKARADYVHDVSESLIVKPGENVTYLGVERPENMPSDYTIITLESLGSLIPG